MTIANGVRDDILSVRINAPGRPETPAAQARALRDAECWLFDLDNTLYPPTINLFAEIDQRMRDFIAAHLGLDIDAAYALQKQYFREHGTTLRGLMDRHALAPGPFLDHVHDIDLTLLDPAPDLACALARLPGRKLVFTNASARHAERVMERLGIADQFEAIFDIEAADYRPKPDPVIYGWLLDRHRVDPRAAVMVEDMARNLKPAADLGITTVWIRNASEHARFDLDAEDHLHHVIDDLTLWLTTIAAVQALATDD